MTGSHRRRQTYVLRELAESGSHSDLVEQFVVSRSAPLPDGWESDTIGSWRLAHHPTLPVISIVDDAGGRLGWLLGYPITPGGRLLVDASSVSVGPDADPLTFVDDLGGRFLAVFVGVAAPAIYPDATGSYSSVFCPSVETAASTPGLIPYEDDTLDRGELIDDLGIPLTTTRLPFGLTSRHGVDRLLPNHHLDLRRWEAVRHGPTWRQRGSVSVEESADRVAAITRRNMAAVMDRYPCYLPLTAGNDSRMLLSCARDRIDELALYTLEIPDIGGATDAYVATRIARRLGLPHQRVSMLRATPADLRRWVHRTGCAVGEPRGLNATTTFRSLDRGRVRLNAQLGNFSRRAHWLPTDREDTPITAERLALHGLGLTRGVDAPSALTAAERRAASSPTVLERAERWKQSARAPDSLALLDLEYLDTTHGSWAGVWPFAEYFGPAFTIFPMNHREIAELIMSLPERTRIDGTFMRDIIQRQWPELLEWPVNTTPRRVRATYFPNRVARGLRRRASRLRTGRG
jgi:hypothetical protein